jgi:hypothetical protein
MKIHRNINSGAVTDASSQIASQFEKEPNKSGNTSSQLLTRRELSSRWNLSVETLKRWENSGKLPFFKLGKQIRYRIKAVEQIETISEVAK